MTCITSTSFEVLINGKSFGKITPSRGLRQGDPLSPFLFILCAEMLAKRFQLAEEEGQIEGIRIASSSPRISHLFFADDSFFFCKAMRPQVETVTRLLSDYNEASGQRINLAKSSIVYGQRMKQNVIEELRHITGIRNDGGKGIYLGLPETFIGSKISTLKFLEQKLDRRVNSWKSKYLSLAGKETLIKAVAMALPTFSMSCFLLPKGTCRAMSSIVSKFWWKNQSSEKGIHWSRWQNLCKAKNEGGLGFREIEGFNIALLGKQIWRVACNPQSLMARVLKGRYFKNGSILTASHGSRPSYAWRSIRHSQQLLRLGMQRTFGNGNNICLLEDPWIVDKQPRPPVLRGGFSPNQFSVRSFIEPGAEEWHLPNLLKAFPEEECKLICRIKPSRLDPSHLYSWIHQVDGRYSVKSGYKVWYKQILNQEEEMQVTNPNLNCLFEGIWNTHTTPKIKYLLWRIISNNLATSVNLKRKSLTKQAECPRCGFEAEDRNHIFFSCPFARAVWACTITWYLFAPTVGDSIYTNVNACLQKAKKKEEVYFWP